MFMKLSSCLIGLILSCSTLFAQGEVHFTPEDRQIFASYLSYIMPYRHLSADSIREKTATFFLGKPYVSHTLEMTDDERLVVNLREFDCTTFVETVIALSRTLESDVPLFETFISELRNIRYRNGVVAGYASRIHYTSDWGYEQEQKGRIKNISALLGGTREEKQINFMSTHRQAYKQLVDDAALRDIISMEQKINARGGFAYLPKAQIAIAAPLIPHMAMIGFVTHINGLDISHVGFAYKNGNKLTFVHASSAQKKVVVDEKTLSDYCKEQKSCAGILVSQIM